MANRPQFFPPPEHASPQGLVGVGGSLSTAWLLDAYRHGIFPWPLNNRILAWFSPDPRAILELDGWHPPRRLARTCRSDRFQVTLDQAFATVVEGCATAGDRSGKTWITEGIATAYADFHRAGYAHSVEVWQGETLVGGLYGVALGGFFAAESMFHRVTDASKVALAHLIRHLAEQGFSLLDVQQRTDHLERLGAIEIPRRQFLARLRGALAEPREFLAPAHGILVTPDR